MHFVWGAKCSLDLDEFMVALPRDHTFLGSVATFERHYAAIKSAAGGYYPGW